MKRSLAFVVAIWLVAGVAMSLALASSATAQIYIMESTAPGIKIGAQLAMTDNVSIPAGAGIRAVLPSGKTQTVKGPYSGLVADIAKGQDVNEGVMSWLKNIMQTGGSTDATPGATRSIAPPVAQRSSPRFSWSDIPTSADGSVCVPKDAKLQLARAPVSAAQRVAVVDAESAARGETDWQVNGDLAAWPANVAVRPGGIYYLLVEGRARRQIKLQVLEELPAEDDLLQALQQRGCRFQFETFVREKLASAKK